MISCAHILKMRVVWGGA